MMSVSKQGVQCRIVLVVNFFVFFEINFVCFVVAIFDLVDDVEAIHCLQLLEIFSEIRSFTGITHFSKNKFQMLFAVKEGEI